MKCIIQCFRPLRNQFEIITLKEGKIYLDDGRYERVVLDDEEEVNDLYSKLFSLMFSWKQEYIGEKIFDGEKYFQDISFTSLERETGDGSYKKVVNLISKINRG